MVKTVTPPAEEYASSSGSNVNAGGTTSIFDSPLAGISNLAISSNEGDDKPFVFDPGETYDLSWTDTVGNTHTMEDATIVRSDYLSGDMGVVVFDGVNSTNGEAFQVIWAPNFDLENWMATNGAGGRTLSFYTFDRSTESYQQLCFTAGTLIATPGGDIPVEQLATGDLVETMDSGAQPIQWIGSETVPGLGNRAPVVFRPGAQGALRRAAVSQQHRVLVGGPRCEALFGVPEALAPAKALVDGLGVVIEQCASVQYFHLLLSQHEVLWADGVLAESLYLGDVALGALQSESGPMPGVAPPDALVQANGAGMMAARMVLTFREARLLAGEAKPDQRAMPSMPPEPPEPPEPPARRKAAF